MYKFWCIPPKGTITFNYNREHLLNGSTPTLKYIQDDDLTMETTFYQDYKTAQNVGMGDGKSSALSEEVLNDRYVCFDQQLIVFLHDVVTYYGKRRVT